MTQTITLVRYHFMDKEVTAYVIGCNVAKCP